MKKGEGKLTKGIELPIQECIVTLGGKKNYKFLEILKEDTIKQTDMKGENISKPNN